MDGWEFGSGSGVGGGLSGRGGGGRCRGVDLGGVS